MEVHGGARHFSTADSASRRGRGDLLLAPVHAAVCLLKVDNDGNMDLTLECRIDDYSIVVGILKNRPTDPE